MSSSSEPETMALLLVGRQASPGPRGHSFQLMTVNPTAPDNAPSIVKLTWIVETPGNCFCLAKAILLKLISILTSFLRL